MAGARVHHVETYAKMIAKASEDQLPNSSYNNSPPASAYATATARLWHAAEKLDRKCVIGYPHGHGHSYECGDRSRLLVVLRWGSGILHKIIDAYLSSPMLMAVVPLLIGLGLGIMISFYMGWSKNCKKTNNENGKGRVVNLASVAIFQMQQWLSNMSSITISDLTLKSQENDKDLDAISNTQDSKSPNKVYAEERLDETNDERDSRARAYLKSDVNTQRESGLELSEVPKHIAVIMDGNRRYGKAKYGSVTKGHWDGSKTLVDFSKWCLAEGVEILTVYAFSTENWNRSASEVSVLMQIFCKYCDELRVEALERGIRLQVLSTETEQIPPDVAFGIERMVNETKHCNNLTMNICLSYGSKGEILNACKAIANDVNEGVIKPSEITETTFERKLLTGGCPDPDLILRTSGEFRLSNFLLWQLAYAEMFFLDKQWPELTKADLLGVIREYAINRKRRFGK